MASTVLALDCSTALTVPSGAYLERNDPKNAMAKFYTRRRIRHGRNPEFDGSQIPIEACIPIRQESKSN